MEAEAEEKDHGVTRRLKSAAKSTLESGGSLLLDGKSTQESGGSLIMDC